MDVKDVWLEGGGGEKLVGLDYFFFESTKIQSPQIKEKTQRKAMRKGS